MKRKEQHRDGKKINFGGYERCRKIRKRDCEFSWLPFKSPLFPVLEKMKFFMLPANGARQKPVACYLCIKIINNLL